jgi:hypothetical protein
MEMFAVLHYIYSKQTHQEVTLARNCQIVLDNTDRLFESVHLGSCSNFDDLVAAMG